MNYRKFVAGFDLHGDMQDTDAVNKILSFTKEFKPDIKIFGGDLFDFRAIRRKADKAEQAESLADDVMMGQEFLRQFKPQVYLRGNHCERLWDMAEGEIGDGLKRDACRKGVQEIEDLCKKQGTKMYPYDKRKGVHREGKLMFIHGYCSGIYALRKTLTSYGESLCMGHVHSNQQTTIEGLSPRRGWVSGCLCKIDYQYNRGNLASLSHEHGFLYGLLFDNGDFIVNQARKTSGDWIVSTNFKKI